MSRGESFRVPRVLFIAEQDGEIERRLKSQVESVLRDSEFVGRAYLCQVRYGEDGPSAVAMCLFVESVVRDDLEKEIGEIFYSMFNTSTSLDIIRISASQNVEIAFVCRPFFGAE